MKAANSCPQNGPLCAAVGFSTGVESANIVGYKGISSGENLSPVMGGVFEPVNGASTYDLRDCQIVGDEGEYCDPGNEYLRVLNPNSLATTVRYTYVSREWMVDNFDDDSDEYIDQFAWAIGWWVYDSSADYQELVESQQDDTLKVKSAINITVGTAFIGSFSSGHALRLVSNGSVQRASSAVATGENLSPMIDNPLPVDTTLFAMTIAGEDESGEYCDPGNEYLRVLNPNSLATTIRYTYISREWMVDNFDDDSDEYIDQFSWAIGWWVYDSSADYQEIIEQDKDTTSELRLTTDVPVPSGMGFIGSFSSGHSLNINFPRAY